MDIYRPSYYKKKRHLHGRSRSHKIRLYVRVGVGGMPGSWHLVVPYLAAGPFLAFMHWGQFCLLAKPKLWLMTFKGWSYVVVGMVLKLTLIQTTNTKNHFTTMMSICLLSLALGGLCQIVYCFR